MPRLHVANTYFEEELEGSLPNLDITQMLSFRPFYLQLQFLPFLYGNEDDYVLVTTLPEADFIPTLQKAGFHPPRPTLTPPPTLELEAWGATPSIEKWAKENGIFFTSPPIEIVKEVTSKAFSFSNSPKLVSATLLYTWDELSAWASDIEGPKILKSCFGVSGRGHLHLKNIDDVSVKAFANRQWAAGLPLIAEPWIDRVLDFSTQWKIHQNSESEFVGTTICENDSRGHYRGTVVGDILKCFGKYTSLLEVHKKEAVKLLDLMKELGFFGHVGFDAMISREGALHPIVEINPRKTMGWVALMLQKNHFPGKTIRLFLGDAKKEKIGLLPFKIGKISFQKQLCVDFVD